MSAAFTPGDWTASPYSSVVGCVVTAQPDKQQNSVRVAGVGGRTKEEAIANAHLIAAAPDLYAQAELLARIIEYEIKKSRREGDEEGARMKTVTLNMCRAALAKATGERP